MWLWISVNLQSTVFVSDVDIANEAVKLLKNNTFDMQQNQVN